MKVNFLNEIHQQRFEKIRYNMAERYQNDKEYLSVAYIMAGNSELESKMFPYFDTKKGYLDAQKLFEEQDLTHGLAMLAKLAINLFNQGTVVTPMNLINHLDSSNYRLAINAIKLRRYGV